MVNLHPLPLYPLTLFKRSLFVLFSEEKEVFGLVS